VRERTTRTSKHVAVTYSSKEDKSEPFWVPLIFQLEPFPGARHYQLQEISVKLRYEGCPEQGTRKHFLVPPGLDLLPTQSCARKRDRKVYYKRGEEGVGMEAGEVEGVGGEVKGGQLAGKGVPLMVAP